MRTRDTTGPSQDLPRARARAADRSLPFGDGPAEVHEHALAGAGLRRRAVGGNRTAARTEASEASTTPAGSHP
ncbi:hypothetical protein [Streptomyces tanashiensis]|uniref:hypothetical protein n=1 Tax=Streptomyces tanashiensis TaxID=67367 RepID=UPI00342C5DF1